MNYPTLNVKQLTNLLSIVEQAAEDPAYLNPENCPYDPNTIKLIQRTIELIRGPDITADISTPTRGKVGRPTKGPSIPMDEVEREVDEIRKELADLKIEGQVMEIADRIQVIKTRAALIERVIGMKERTADVKRYHSFVKQVIGIMEEHLPPKEREAVVAELKEYVEA